MRRFFCPAEKIAFDRAIIDDKNEIHHIIKVLRFKVSDKILIFDGENNEYSSRIIEVRPNKIVLKILARNSAPVSKKLKTCIACALAKSKTFSYIVEKLTEIGTDTIIPLVTERTISNIDKSGRETKISRWKKIALNAAKQSRRLSLPVIGQVTDFEEALRHINEYELRLIASVLPDCEGIAKVLGVNKFTSVIVFIGPEGDFTSQEIAKAKALGCIPVNLGSTILKVDTAAIYTASIINACTKS